MGEVYIVGAGRGDPDSLSILDSEELRGVKIVACHLFPEHVKKTVCDEGYQVVELDNLVKADTSWETARKAAHNVLELAEKEGSCAVLLPGAPWTGDCLYMHLRLLARKKGIICRVLFGEDIWSNVMEKLFSELESRREDEVFGCSGTVLYDIYSLEELNEPVRGDLLVANISAGRLLSFARQRLLRFYGEGHEVNLLQFDRDGSPYLLGSTTLKRLEELQPLHCWSFLHLPPFQGYTLGDMMYLMERLRAPGGCPWDREQDHQSLKPYLLEEAYEVLGAIDQGDEAELCEELGDLLLQVAFHSQVAAERNAFTLWKVITDIADKIYRRHPHVFQRDKAENAQEVSLKWQEIKRNEKKKENRFDMSEALPSLMKAQKVQKRAAEVGFDWPDVKGALDKIREEIEELQGVIEKEEKKDLKKEKLEEEIGDLFFALVNVARFLGIESELALYQALEKFKNRFSYIEEQVNKRGGDYSCFSLEDLDGWWDEAKLKEKRKK